ncbi:MAG: hypothetical protein ACRDNF_00105 [Streptosporangiaceae bacterium]
MPVETGCAAADICGVAGPVAGGEALPGDGDVGADAEGAGEDGCEDFGGELEQCRATGLAGADPEGLGPEGEPLAADREGGLAAGGQPMVRV